jgi:predicted nucleotidyltransferase
LPVSRLTQLQRDVLQKFFAREERFFLTGGAALAGFHLGHRETDDLDLFTSTQAGVLEAGEVALQQVAQELGATLNTLVKSPDYKRLILRRGSEELKVDLAYDPHQFRPKVILDGIRIDSAEEITINKLTTLLSRSEIRDLVDLMKLEAAGHTLEEALPHAAEKDLGLTPGALVEVLSDVTIGDDAPIPGGVSAAELRRYLEGLIDRLVRMAFPR